LLKSAASEPVARQRAHQLEEGFLAQVERDRGDTLNLMLLASLVALGVVGITAAGLGWVVAGRALQPLQRITATARRVADRNLHERIALDGPRDELKDLADTFDAMLERLDRAFDGQHRFVANASHELRTPLAINRALIEVALDDPHASEPMRQLARTLLAVNERHERLIDGLLTLATGEQEITRPVPVDFSDVVRHVSSECAAAAQAAGIDLRTSCGGAAVSGDPLLLERLVRNLLDNAIRYNVPEGGFITVTTGRMAGQALLTVENTGPAVPPHEIPTLFEPFRRLAAERLADSSRSAVSRVAGLGLSIVESIARAHGGEVCAHSRQGGGLVVEVRLPSLALV
jgi:signal transduction histidine kinase